MVVTRCASVPVRASRLRHRGLDTSRALTPATRAVPMPLHATSRAVGAGWAAGFAAFTPGASNSIYMIMPVQTCTWS
jgi:hypothetical protein